MKRESAHPLPAGQVVSIGMLSLQTSAGSAAGAAEREAPVAGNQATGAGIALTPFARPAATRHCRSVDPAPGSTHRPR